MGFGTQVMMYVGAMNNISESIVEYGKIDGVTPIQEFIHITIPLVYPTVTTMVVVNLSGILINQMGLYNFFSEYAEYPLRTIGYNFYVNTLLARRVNGEGYALLSTQGILFTFITVPVVLGSRWLMNKFGPNLEN